MYLKLRMILRTLHEDQVSRRITIWEGGEERLSRNSIDERERISSYVKSQISITAARC